MKSYYDKKYVRRMIKTMDLYKDGDMKDAMYIDLLQDFVLECARGRIDSKEMAKVIHKECKFKIEI